MAKNIFSSKLFSTIPNLNIVRYIKSRCRAETILYSKRLVGIIVIR